MGEKLTRIWVNKDLKEGMEDFRKRIALDLKKKYNLTEITIPQSLSSQILAAKMQGKDFINFNIRKVELNKGILELL